MTITNKTEIFIQKAKKIHGDKYDYSLIDYTIGHRVYDVICKEHGIFKIRGQKHLIGDGCQTCSKIKTREQSRLKFITESIEIHGDIYDYSLVEYIDCNKEVKIVCKNHGIFNIQPTKHKFHKIGCSACVSNTRKKDNEYFIKKALEIHGDIYDYSLVEYKGFDSYVDIICKKHGVFSKKAKNHISGKKTGCGKCFEKVLYDTEYYIEKCKEKHNDLYDYSLINFKSSITNIDIICKKHGVFSMLPRKFLSGNHCYTCVAEKTFIEKSKKIYGDSLNYTKVSYVNDTVPIVLHCNKHNHDFEHKPSLHMKSLACDFCVAESKILKFKQLEINFIKKSKMKNGDLYDYSKVEYKGKDEKVVIICNEHGEFTQTPHGHRASGCPSCSKYSTTSFPEQAFYYYLAKIFNKVSSQYKIDNIEMDIMIHDINLCIEYDGAYWHRDKEEYDYNKTMNIIEKGINVIRIRENTLNALGCCVSFTRKSDSMHDLENVINETIMYIQKTYNVVSSINVDLKKDTIDIYNSIKNNKYEKSIEFTHPHLLHEWDYMLNKTVLPKHLTYGSHVKVWWKCTNNHSWNSSVKHRCRVSGCPECFKNKFKK